MRRLPLSRFLTLGLLAAACANAAGQATAPAPVLANISTRLGVETGDNVLIGGFIITGNTPKRVIVRASGPWLKDYGIVGALEDPTLQIFRGQELIAENNNWRESQEAEIQASTIPPNHDLESAIVRTLEPGAYTAIMRGNGGTTGIGLLEVYDLDPGAESKLGNIAMRGLVQAGDNPMIAGVIARGDTGSSRRVAVLVAGPSLPLNGKLPDPTLELVNSNGVVLRANDNWRTTQAAEIQESGVAPGNDLEPALVHTIGPGNYTAVVRGVGNSAGIAVVQVYTLDNNYGAWPLAGDDPNLGSTADLEPLRGLIGNATVAAFGESYHTSGGFYRMKHRIFRFLVQEMGFRAFAIESGWEGAELAGTYVRTGAGTPEQAINKHINVWQGTEYADLVRWIREWNASHPNPADKVAYFGFDIQQPNEDATGLVNYLGRIGIPSSDPRASGLSSCEGVGGKNHPFGQIPPERHQTCLQSLASIEDHFTANTADLVGRTSQQDFDIAMLRVVGLRAWENQVFIIAHDRPVGYSARDEGMAYAFQVMRNMKAPNAKTMVWAANSHVARAPLATGEVPMGSHLANAFGENYVSFALNAFTTEVDYGTCGEVPRQPDSLEDALAPVLAAQSAAAMLIDTRASTPVIPHRVYATGIDQLRPHLEYNGIFYLQHSPKFHPLLWAPCD